MLFLAYTTHNANLPAFFQKTYPLEEGQRKKELYEN